MYQRQLGKIYMHGLQRFLITIKKYNLHNYAEMNSNKMP